MARTNIDIDDELVRTVMEQQHLATKREAVDYALRKAVRRQVTREEILALRGIGFDMSNEEIEETSRPRDWNLDLPLDPPSAVESTAPGDERDQS